MGELLRFPVRVILALRDLVRPPVQTSATPASGPEPAPHGDGERGANPGPRAGG